MVCAYTEDGLSMLPACIMTATLHLAEPPSPDNEFPPMVPLMHLKLAQDTCSPRKPCAPRKVLVALQNTEQDSRGYGRTTARLRLSCGEYAALWRKSAPTLVSTRGNRKLQE